jgi:hypothetical protein
VPSPEFLLVQVDLNSTVTASISEEGRGLAEQTAAAKSGGGGQSFRITDVRRPLRGIQIKEDTYAALTVYSPYSQLEIHNSSAPEGTRNYTTNFILQSVQETRQEKFQPFPTFGNTFGFFFGEQPRFMSFSAILLNTADFQWEIEWWANYEEFLRGTRLTDRQMRAYLTYDDVVIEGYITNASTSKTASTPYEVPLQFSMWVTGIEYLVTAGDPIFPTDDGSEPDESLLMDYSFIGGWSAEFHRITDEVRASNIKAKTSNFGLLSSLRQELANVQDMLDESVRTLSNFLYGTNLVIPVGFAGSESGNRNVILPVNIPAGPQRGRFYDNFDEYPIRESSYWSTAFLWNAEWKRRVGVLTAISETFMEDVDVLATKQAEDAFKSLGIQVSNMDGEKVSETSRKIGKATFAAVSLLAAYSGASQAAASLTVGNVAAGVEDTIRNALGVPRPPKPSTWV